MANSRSTPPHSDALQALAVKAANEWNAGLSAQEVDINAMVAYVLSATPPTTNAVQNDTPANQEQCSYCGDFYPKPVSLHHTTEECNAALSETAQSATERSAIIEECAKFVEDHAEGVMGGREYEWSRLIARNLRAIDSCAASTSKESR